MKRKGMIASALVLGLLLVLAAGITLAQEPEPPEGVGQPQGNLSMASVVTSTISYQGVLKENGSPVTGSRSMIFRLYSDDACATQVGSNIDAGSVQMNDGLFDVDLPVNPDDFNGQGLWLEAEVGGAKIGCEEIQPVPYALSLRPGAKVIGASGLTGNLFEASTSDGSSLKVSMVQGLVFGGASLYASNDSIGYGVYGEYVGTSDGSGVYGSTSDAGGYGIYGKNSAGGYAGYFEGDVGQRRTDDGLVKAAVYAAQCANSGSSIQRSFNNVNSTAITIIDGASSGKCTIDFGFDINDRFWSATSYGLVAQGVSCQQGTSSDQLDCYRWSTAPTGVDGGIMIVVY